MVSTKNFVNSEVISGKLNISNDVFNRYIQSLISVVKNYVTVEKYYVMCDPSLESFLKFFHERVVREGLESATKNTLKEMRFLNIDESYVSEISDYYTLGELLKKCGLSSKALFYKKINGFEDVNKYTIPCRKRVLYHKSFIPVLSNIVHYGKILSRTSKNYHNHTLKVISIKELSKLTKISVAQLENLIFNNKYYKSFVKLINVGQKKSYIIDIRLVDIILQRQIADSAILDDIYSQDTTFEDTIESTIDPNLNVNFSEHNDFEGKKMVVKLRCKPSKEESNDTEINSIKHNLETLTIENKDLQTKLSNLENENLNLKTLIETLNSKLSSSDESFKTQGLEFKLEKLQLENENSKLKVENLYSQQKFESLELEIKILTEKLQILESELKSIKNSSKKYSITDLFKRGK